MFVFDHSTKKSFRTLLRNSGARRNFSRIEPKGLDANHVEDGMAEIEGEIPRAWLKRSKQKSFPSDGHFSIVMLLMGNGAVRNPRFLSMIENLHLKMAGGMMKAAPQDKDRYQEFIR